MEAKEAREVADLNKLEGIEEVFLKIREDAKAGKYESFVNRHFNKFIKDHLEKLGYTVAATSARGKDLTRISW